MAFIIGKWSDESKADSRIQGIADDVKVAVEGKLQKKMTTYKVISYRQQIVLGMNYLIKIQTFNGYIHIKVFVSSSGSALLRDIQEKKTLKDPLNPF
ncbi:hypothetical protein DICPUDRAFT_151460 [Dictyostelium purpureum]|uniref:Cystatin domain-containing protein n=1 Tax=Dictyostelium purpureum TaxID=5786 RepID=F0ZIW9_DICPU|nr:uncharacterized protein DICPUDRAFT_151460 [Dictyostelium purpureum]EGC36099.1 hypothetical protein DICPUDRAFT_151460 [Dictyostelium purpureum]|eukprot:XP_003287356.1 hypothetical protein DICPUDRAFT_151460 [Dictyostelium purpureum]